MTTESIPPALPPEEGGIADKSIEPYFFQRPGNRLEDMVIDFPVGLYLTNRLGESVQFNAKLVEEYEIEDLKQFLPGGDPGLTVLLDLLLEVNYLRYGDKMQALMKTLSTFIDVMEKNDNE